MEDALLNYALVEHGWNPPRETEEDAHRRLLSRFEANWRQHVKAVRERRGLSGGESITPGVPTSPEKLAGWDGNE